MDPLAGEKLFLMNFVQPKSPKIYAVIASDISHEEFVKNYIDRLDMAIMQKANFIVTDITPGDWMVQRYLHFYVPPSRVRLYHKMGIPKNNLGFPAKGIYLSDRDVIMAMKNESNDLIYWNKEGETSLN